MPSCSNCHMLIDNTCTAHIDACRTLGRELPPPPLGACMIPIVHNYLELILPGMRILEIGCGSWDLIQRHCNKVGAEYEGIDPQREYFGKPTVATRIENLAQLSFPDAYFDLVIGNQTMEHWGEYGCSLQWGLYQCFRVCRKNGSILMNVPIHFHGTRQFMLGDIRAINDVLTLFSHDISYERWGLPSSPLSPLFPFPGYWVLRQKPAYVLDISAVKNRSLPFISNNRFAMSGRLAQIFQYPVSFNIYRVLHKAKLI